MIRPDPLSRVLPFTCLLCGAPGARRRDLCPGCAAELPVNRHACARCALPFDTPIPPGTLCGHCQRRAPPFERCIAALRYQGPARFLVAAAKFRGRLCAARLLGGLLADAVADPVPGQPRSAGPEPSAPWDSRWESPPEALVPVPLHPRRLAERGYNQALEIARTLGRELGIPVDPYCCERIAATAPQAGLDERARRRNMGGAFSASAPFPWRSVAIVDDVVTTGSTVMELTRVLRRAGAQRVAVWAAARTP